MKYKDLGTMLSKDEMKAVKGGIGWEEKRDYKCNVNGQLMQGGCTSASHCAHAYCVYTYGTSNVEWGAFGCTVDTGCI